MKLGNFFRSLIVLVCCLSLIWIKADSTQAQDAQLDRIGITVSPVIDEFTIKPGTSVQRIIKITNPVRDVVTLYPLALNVYTDNEDGKPKFYTLQEKNSRYALSNWVSFSKPVIKIAPGEFEQFELTVAAPSDAEPGGHYGAILFSTEEPKLNQNKSEVAVVGLIGTLVLATVPGDIKQNTYIEDFTGPRFLIKAPANFSLLFTNRGNVHSKPQGEIKIRNWFGDAASILKINESAGNVLPESKRRFNSSWQFNWKAFGKYTANVLVTYGNPEQQLSAQRSFYIIPPWFFASIGVILLILIWLLVRRKRQKKLTANYAESMPGQLRQGPKPNRPIIR